MIKPSNVLNFVTLFFTTSNLTFDFPHNQTSTNLVYNLSEFSDNSTDYVAYFPKCCHKEYSYNFEESTCVNRNSRRFIWEEFNITAPTTLTFLWAECPVRIERFVEKGNVIILEGNTRLVIGDETYAEAEFCMDKIVGNNDYYVIKLCKGVEYCYDIGANNMQNRCIPKCCLEHQILHDGLCVSNPEPSSLIKNIKYSFEGDRDDFAVFTPFVTPQCNLFHAALYNKTENTIKEDGTLVDKASAREFKLDEYCLEEGFGDQTGEYITAIITCENVVVTYYNYLTRASAALSLVGFLMTIMIYVFVYKLKKPIHVLVVCVSTISSVYWIKINLVFYAVDFGAYCTYIAYISDFTESAIMTSTNVLTFELWRTLGRTRSKVRDVEKKWLKTYLSYSVYIVTYPMVCSVVQILSQNDILKVPSTLQPELDSITCGFLRILKGNYYNLLFYLPQSILIMINVIFYIKTIRYVLKVKSDINKMINRGTEKQSNIKIVEAQIALVTKIGVISGMTWITLFFVPIYMIVHNEENDSADSVRYCLIMFISLEGVYFFLVLGVKWKWIKEIYQKLICKGEATNTSNLNHTLFSVQISNIQKGEQCQNS